MQISTHSNISPIQSKALVGKIAHIPNLQRTYPPEDCVLPIPRFTQRTSPTTLDFLSDMSIEFIDRRKERHACRKALKNFKVIGSGSRGTAFRSRYYPGIVKKSIFKSSKQTNKDFIASVSREIYFQQLASECSESPAITQVELISDEHLIFSMKDVGNKSYIKIIADDDFPPLEEQIRLTISVLETLRSFHENGFCHGDTRAWNLIVSRDNKTIHVIDFDQAGFKDEQLFDNELEFIRSIIVSMFRDKKNIIKESIWPLFDSTPKENIVSKVIEAFKNFHEIDR